MLTEKRYRWRAIAIGFAMVAATLVGAGRTATAATATLTDPNDTSSKLDVVSGNVSNTPSTINYALQMDSFAASDVSKVILEFDFNEDGNVDNCLRVNQSSAPSGLEGNVYDDCSGSSLVGTADAVTITGGNTLNIALNIQELKNAGLNNDNAYQFRVLTLDVPSGSASTFNDTAPDTGFVAHSLGAVYCGAVVSGSVKLLADITGCRGDGLSVGKKKTKINLNGHTISSAYGSTPPGDGVTVGINAGAFITVNITNGTISGFGTGIKFNNSMNKKNKPGKPKTESLIKAVTVSGNTTGIDLTGGQYIGVQVNTIQSNKGVGVKVTGSKMKLLSNTITGNSSDGVQQPSGTKLTMTSNQVNGNGTQPPGLPATGDGIDVDGTLAKISKNTANNNDGAGIAAPGDATGSGNTATGNAGTQCDPAALCS